jgi:hypothetical protein
MGDPMSLADFRQPWFSVKEAVLPFARFPGVDTLLGPEMRSTGEVMGWDRTFPRAFLKAQLGAGTHLPDAGTVFISIKDADKTPDACGDGTDAHRSRPDAFWPPAARRPSSPSTGSRRTRSTRPTRAAAPSSTSSRTAACSWS